MKEVSFDVGKYIHLTATVSGHKMEPHILKIYNFIYLIDFLWPKQFFVFIIRVIKSKMNFFFAIFIVEN